MSAEQNLKAIIAHWNEFGPEHGFGELMDKVQEKQTPSIEGAATVQSTYKETERQSGETLANDSTMPADLLDEIESIVGIGPIDGVHALDRYYYDGSWRVEPLDEALQGPDYFVLQGRRSFAFRVWQKLNRSQIAKEAARYRYLRDTKDWPREVCDVMENICSAQEHDDTIDAAMFHAP